MIDTVRRYGLSFVFGALGVLGLLMFFNQAMKPQQQTCALPPTPLAPVAAAPVTASDPDPQPQRPAEGVYMIPAPKGKGKMVITIVTTDETDEPVVTRQETKKPVKKAKPKPKAKPKIVHSEFYVPPARPKTPAPQRAVPQQPVGQPRPKVATPPVAKTPVYEDDIYVVPLGEEDLDDLDTIPGIPEVD